jgi:hypothetical protein
MPNGRGRLLSGCNRLPRFAALDGAARRRGGVGCPVGETSLCELTPRHRPATAPEASSRDGRWIGSGVTLEQE